MLAFMGDPDRSPVGTLVELGWADAYRKPVVLVGPPSAARDHPLVSQIAGYTVETLEEGIALTRAFLL